MRVDFDKNQSNRVASDDADGRFYSGVDGTILYLEPGEMQPWYVNANLEKFRKSINTYKNYGIEVVKKETEDEHLKVVDTFKKAVLEIEDFGKQGKSYWSSIVQQAEEGQI